MISARPSSAGHTPDSLCLLDRENRLLFTGDTFYLGPIYLYVPETDVAAYERSVASLAQLVPDLDLLLPAHNVPVAEPRNLARLSYDASRCSQSVASDENRGEHGRMS